MQNTIEPSTTNGQVRRLFEAGENNSTDKSKETTIAEVISGFETTPLEDTTERDRQPHAVYADCNI